LLTGYIVFIVQDRKCSQFLMLAICAIFNVFNIVVYLLGQTVVPSLTNLIGIAVQLRLVVFLCIFVLHQFTKRLQLLGTSSPVPHWGSVLRSSANAPHPPSRLLHSPADLGC